MIIKTQTIQTQTTAEGYWRNTKWDGNVSRLLLTKIFPNLSEWCNDNGMKTPCIAAIVSQSTFRHHKYQIQIRKDKAITPFNEWLIRKMFNVQTDYKSCTPDINRTGKKPNQPTNNANRWITIDCKNISRFTMLNFTKFGMKFYSTPPSELDWMPKKKDKLTKKLKQLTKNTLDEKFTQPLTDMIWYDWKLTQEMIYDANFKNKKTKYVWRMTDSTFDYKLTHPHPLIHICGGMKVIEEIPAPLQCTKENFLGKKLSLTDRCLF